MKHWSALSQNRLTATLLLNNIVERMVAPFGVREEGGFVEQEDAIMGIFFGVNQVMLNDHFFKHGSNLLTCLSHFIYQPAKPFEMFHLMFMY